MVTLTSETALASRMTNTYGLMLLLRGRLETPVGGLEIREIHGI